MIEDMRLNEEGFRRSRRASDLQASQPAEGVQAATLHSVFSVGNIALWGYPTEQYLEVYTKYFTTLSFTA
jgi:hypothetical protein